MSRFESENNLQINLSSITACLFDLDGVLVDTAKYHFLAWKRLANELGFDFTEHQNESLKGISRMQSLDLILEWGGVHLNDAEKLNWATLKNDWYLELVNQMIPDEILPGVLPFLAEIKAKGIKIALGSVSKNAGLILEKTALTTYFDAIIDGNQITNSKPHPEVFEKGALALGKQAQACVVFEDAVAGIEAARRANMLAVGIGDAQILTRADWVIAGFEGITWAQVLLKLQQRD
jgi:beta-phosphoglucomutase